jgi:hypothetical protein
MKMYVSFNVYIHLFLNMIIDEDEWSDLSSGRFNPGKMPLYALVRTFDGLQSRPRLYGQVITLGLLNPLGHQPVASRYIAVLLIHLLYYYYYVVVVLLLYIIKPSIPTGVL